MHEVCGATGRAGKGSKDVQNFGSLGFAVEEAGLELAPGRGSRSRFGCLGSVSAGSKLARTAGRIPFPVWPGTWKHPPGRGTQSGPGGDRQVSVCAADLQGIPWSIPVPCGAARAAVGAGQRPGPAGSRGCLPGFVPRDRGADLSPRSHRCSGRCWARGWGDAPGRGFTVSRFPRPYRELGGAGS